MIEYFFHRVALAVFLFHACVLTESFATKYKLNETADFEGGRLFSAGAIPVVVLTGNFRQMGRQYGKLLDSHLADAYQAVFTDRIIDGKTMSLEQVGDFSRYVWNFYPARFKEFTKGAAETSSLDLGQLVMLDQYMWLVIVRELDQSGACSMLAAFDKYTEGAAAFAARVSDFPDFPDSALCPPVVTIMRPDTGDIPVCTVGFPGQMQILTAMNAYGIVVMQNNAPLSGDKRRILDRVNNLTRAREWMFNADSLEFIEIEVNSMNSSHASVILAVSHEDALIYEAATHETRKRIGASRGLAVADNHFSHPAWDTPEESPEFLKSLKRRNNLLMHMESAKGKLTSSKTRDILDLDKDSRGVFTEHTRLQVMFELPGRTVWIKAPGLQDWTEINVAPLLAPLP